MWIIRWSIYQTFKGESLMLSRNGGASDILNDTIFGFSVNKTRIMGTADEGKMGVHAISSQATIHRDTMLSLCRWR